MRQVLSDVDGRTGRPRRAASAVLNEPAGRSFQGTDWRDLPADVPVLLRVRAAIPLAARHAVTVAIARGSTSVAGPDDDGRVAAVLGHVASIGGVAFGAQVLDLASSVPETTEDDERILEQIADGTKLAQLPARFHMSRSTFKRRLNVYRSMFNASSLDELARRLRGLGYGDACKSSKAVDSLVQVCELGPRYGAISPE